MKNVVVFFFAICIGFSSTAFPKPSDSFSGLDEIQYRISGGVGVLTQFNPHFQSSHQVSGVGIQLDRSLEPELKNFSIASQFGYYFGLKSEENYWCAPIMIRPTYHFEGSSLIEFYFAIAAGVSFIHGLNNASDLDIKTDYAFVVIPGVSLGMDRKWFLEVLTGVYSTQFAFLPSLGFRF